MRSWHCYTTCSNFSEAVSGPPNGSCMFRPILLTFLCGLVAAQQPTPAPPPQPAQTPQEEKPFTFVGGVEVVQAPVLVFDRDGNYVDGLQPYQFYMFDNGAEQRL